MLVTGLPDEYTEEASGGTKLKRASSWKKFKSTVKGWVGQPEGEPGGGGDPAVPSAVYPTEDVTRCVIQCCCEFHGSCMDLTTGELQGVPSARELGWVLSILLSA